MSLSLRPFPPLFLAVLDRVDPIATVVVMPSLSGISSGCSPDKILKLLRRRIVACRGTFLVVALLLLPMLVLSFVRSAGVAEGPFDTGSGRGRAACKILGHGKLWPRLAKARPSRLQMLTLPRRAAIKQGRGCLQMHRDRTAS